MLLASTFCGSASGLVHVYYMLCDLSAINQPHPLQLALHPPQTTTLEYRRGTLHSLHSYSYQNTTAIVAGHFPHLLTVA